MTKRVKRDWSDIIHFVRSSKFLIKSTHVFINNNLYNLYDKRRDKLLKEVVEGTELIVFKTLSRAHRCRVYNFAEKK